MAKVCIMCAKEVREGAPVEDDWVIRSIRAIKQRLGIAKNNTLVVCPGCGEAYDKRRANYEKKIVQHVVIAAVVLIVFIALPLATSGFSPWSVVLGAVFAAGVMLLSAFSHCPKIAAGSSQGALAAAHAGGRKKKAGK